MSNYLQNTSRNYHNINVKLNRLYAQKSYIQNQIKLKNKSQRKARTRTLIQFGGILSLTPLLDICGINLGDDLQLSYQNKSDLLLGILSTLFDSLSDNFDASDLDHFQNLGRSLRTSHVINKLGA